MSASCNDRILSVKRSRVYITLLLSLFMFQSFWNVAAAFCVHDAEPKSIAVLSHFGHHSTGSCESRAATVHPKNTVQVQTAFDLATFQQDDHSDHLPSFAHIMLIEAQQLAVSPVFIPKLVQVQFNWQNLYQSPYLFPSNPPPVLAPL
ncbi:cation efflux protein, CzcI-like [Acinetobacter zhairhuonensis]|uniref:cation efflux protein, CzcI-like n=1 Tax=Acinetobacter sp. A7.4 TaxID=2919921 RepID=UPI0032AF1F2A